MKRLQSSLLVCFVVVSSGLLTGCNVEKARAIQGAAIQFKSESLEAIQAIALRIFLMRFSIAPIESLNGGDRAGKSKLLKTLLDRFCNFLHD